MKTLVTLCLTSSMLFSSVAVCQVKWTVMVYMNADNDLERFGIRDFLEMSKVDNSPDVNILVQMDRTPEYSSEYGDWTQTLRFKVSKNMAPTKEASLLDLGEKNMGDPNALKDFIEWGKKSYPAENYILIIWDHGDGWRYTEVSALNEELKKLYVQDYSKALAANENIKRISDTQNIELWATDISLYKSEQQNLTLTLNETARKISLLPDALKKNAAANADFLTLYSSFRTFVSNSFEKIPTNQLLYVDNYSNTLENILSLKTRIENLQQKIESSRHNVGPVNNVQDVSNLKMGDIGADPVKSVSHDNTDKDVLYNKEIKDALSDKIVSVIGFDACLMSMLETGYVLRNKCDYLIGSEELEPGNGWNYTLWLGDLVVNPKMSPLELSKNIVENYKKTYQYQNEVTLSAIDLGLIQDVSTAINNISKDLINNLANEQNNVSSARDNCQKYATDYAAIHSIDLSLFLYHLENKSQNILIKKQSSQIRSLINLLVIANFFSDDRKFESEGVSYGSLGIAIYFPKRKEYFDKAYTDANLFFPVEFVKDNSWDNFLQMYLARQ